MDILFSRLLYSVIRRHREHGERILLSRALYLPSSITREPKHHCGWRFPSFYPFLLPRSRVSDQEAWENPERGSGNSQTPTLGQVDTPPQERLVLTHLQVCSLRLREANSLPGPPAQRRRQDKNENPDLGVFALPQEQGEAVWTSQQVSFPKPRFLA